MTRPSTNPRGADTRERPAFRPRAESLEGRLLLSTTAGELDGSFGTGGYVLTNSPTVTRDGSPVGDRAYAVAIQPDGKILAAGDRQAAWAFEVVRLLPNGSLDPGFGSGGRVMPLEVRSSVRHGRRFPTVGRHRPRWLRHRLRGSNRCRPRPLAA